MFDIPTIPAFEVKMIQPECANCGQDCDSEEQLQTHLGRVCTACFKSVQDKAAANREKFGYKFKKAIKSLRKFNLLK